MSWEGFVQVLCANGHVGSQTADYRDDTCLLCDAPIIWENVVHETNGNYCDCKAGKEAEESLSGFSELPGCSSCDRGRIDCYVELKQLTPEEVETCTHCGASKVVKDATYEVPVNKGRRIK